MAAGDSPVWRPTSMVLYFGRLIFTAMVWRQEAAKKSWSWAKGAELRSKRPVQQAFVSVFFLPVVFGGEVNQAPCDPGCSVYYSTLSSSNMGLQCQMPCALITFDITASGWASTWAGYVQGKLKELKTIKEASPLVGLPAGSTELISHYSMKHGKRHKQQWIIRNLTGLF